MPLKQLKLDMSLSRARDNNNFDFFKQSNYDQLLQFLQSTELEELHLASLNNFPLTPSGIQIDSLTVLRLSGSPSLRHTVRLGVQSR